MSRKSSEIPPNESEDIDFEDLTPFQCVQMLQAGMNWAATNGTSDYSPIGDQSFSKEFEQLRREHHPGQVLSKFYYLMERAKLQAMREGVSLPDQVLQETCWDRVMIGMPLPEADRYRLLKLVELLEPLSYKFHLPRR